MSVCVCVSPRTICKAGTARTTISHRGDKYPRRTNPPPELSQPPNSPLHSKARTSALLNAKESIEDNMDASKILSKEVTIRHYKTEDYTRCREIFTEGMQQLVNPVMDIVFPRYLKIASILLIFVLAAAFRWSLWIVGLYILCCVILTALLYIDIYIEVMKFISGCLNSDLLDISECYKGDSCMFVAEMNGEVVGMAGLRQSDQQKPGIVELQRMSVSRTIRRKGIAKSLCKELIAFAKLKNYNKIVLSTTGAQGAAKALYNKCGFQMVHQFPYPQRILEELSYDCFELNI